MYELRVLTGLHRGATLPLDEDSHLIGASEDADVVLVDDCIKPKHAVLTRTESGWVLTAEGDAPLFSADSNMRQAVIDIAAGDFVRLGDVWITVTRQDANWEKPPSPPADEQFEPEQAGEPEPAPDSANVAQETVSQSSADQSRAAKKRRDRWILATPVVAIVILSAAAAYALAPRSAQPDLSNKQSSAAVGNTAPPAKPPERPNISSADEGKPLPNSGTNENLTLTKEELRHAFRKRLTDAALIEQFDLTLGDKSWTMRANLEEEEAARFERVLDKFLNEHHISFPVTARIVPAEGMLPFQIRQVISGSNASVVTQDGERLYVGDEYLGVRLVAVQDNHLTFAGKRKIEIDW